MSLTDGQAITGYSYYNVAGTTTGVAIKSTGGVLHTLTINKVVASAVITLYDGISTGGKLIGTITLPGTLLAQGPVNTTYDVGFATGLYIVVATGGTDITVVYA